MASRLNLHEEFCNILGSRSVYFNPPESVKMQYPGIRYSLSKVSVKRANNRVYNNTNGYEVILIDTDPNSKYHDEILTRLPLCSFDRTYKANNLNHFVYTIYY